LDKKELGDDALLKKTQNFPFLVFPFIAEIVLYSEISINALQEMSPIPNKSNAKFTFDFFQICAIDSYCNFVRTFEQIEKLSEN